MLKAICGTPHFHHLRCSRIHSCLQAMSIRRCLQIVHRFLLLVQLQVCFLHCFLLSFTCVHIISTGTCFQGLVRVQHIHLDIILMPQIMTAIPMWEQTHVTVIVIYQMACRVLSTLKRAYVMLHLLPSYFMMMCLISRSFWNDMGCCARGLMFRSINTICLLTYSMDFAPETPENLLLLDVVLSCAHCMTIMKPLPAFRKCCVR
jgi:hypothetical protein